MKSILSLCIVVFSCMLLVNAYADNKSLTHIRLDGQQAKDMYLALTGSAVQQEGAAGHLYREGKDIVCRYTNADMSDENGNNVTRDALVRYHCAIQFDQNGLASLDSNF